MIYIPKKLKYKEQRRRAIKKGYCNNYDLKESDKYAEYIRLLDSILVKYHGTLSGSKPLMTAYSGCVCNISTHWVIDVTLQIIARSSERSIHDAGRGAGPYLE